MRQLMAAIRGGMVMAVLWGGPLASVELAPGCVSAVEKAAGRYSRCLLNAHAQFAKSGDETKLDAKHEKCRDKFDRRIDAAIRKYGEEQCTPDVLVDAIDAEVASSSQQVTTFAQGASERFSVFNGGSAFDWVGTIGVDYQPNHYPSGHIFNGHDVFYAGMDGGMAVTNIYKELAQLQAAGFAAVRSYQTEAYSWIDLIKQADALGLPVVYEAAIPINATDGQIEHAVHVLEDVIKGVTQAVFGKTVVLVLAGHENYDSTDVSSLKNALSKLQSALTLKGLSGIPVGTALVSGDLVDPANPSDIEELINASSSTAPLGFDPYPFQWGVKPAADAASDATLMNSIAWDYDHVKNQSFYPSGRTILMTETGWATKGTTFPAGYYCLHHPTTNPCKPGVTNAADYLQDLYAFVRKATNTSGALVFEAYDEPAKDPSDTNAEDHYGVFDSNCDLKNTNLLPNTRFVTGANPGCKGFTEGVTFAVAGTEPHNETKQGPFRVEITNSTNPTTGEDASMDVTIPTMDRTDPSVNPWPQFLLFNNATVKLTGLTSHQSCTFTGVQVHPSTSSITWGTHACTKPDPYTVNCTNRTCSLPWKNF